MSNACSGAPRIARAKSPASACSVHPAPRPRPSPTALPSSSPNTNWPSWTGAAPPTSPLIRPPSASTLPTSDERPSTLNQQPSTVFKRLGQRVPVEGSPGNGRRSKFENVNIKETIAAINRMQADGIIDRYAIGGAVGATFYLEPVATLDVYVFITFRAEAGKALISPQPIFDYLKKHGGTMQGEYIVVAGWPVQFLPPGTPLVEEALQESVE